MEASTALEKKIARLAQKGELYAREYPLWISSITGRQFSSHSDVASVLLRDKTLALKIVLNSAFARAGGEQAGYGQIASVVLNSIQSKNLTPELAWSTFESRCKERNKCPNEKLNKGVVTGLIDCACKRGNIVGYFRDKLASNAEGAFLELLTIAGIGEKVAPFVLRDIAWLYDLEIQIPLRYRVYLQPVDRWVRRVAACLWPDLSADKVPNWLIATRIVYESNRLNISGISLNQGAWYFGAKEVQDEKYCALD